MPYQDMRKPAAQYWPRFVMYISSRARMASAVWLSVIRTSKYEP